MSDAATTQDSRPLTQDGPPIRLYLIDGSAYIFRAYHALPPLTRKSDGLPVGAVAGFCNMLFKLLRDTKEDAPTHFAVIFDHSEKTFRNKMYDLYKAHRRRRRTWCRSSPWSATRRAPSACRASNCLAMRPTT